MLWKAREIMITHSKSNLGWDWFHHNVILARFWKGEAIRDLFSFKN